LMEERHLSYRQLAYKTKLSAGYLNHLTKGTRPVPADSVLAVLAEALCVEPDFFIEYRLRQGPACWTTRRRWPTSCTASCSATSLCPTTSASA
jgi:transcriptional regulator with XRE-family HTH domain